MPANKTELEALGMRELRSRAQRVGVAPQAIEDARDGADPKGELVQLIIVAVDTLDGLGVKALRAKAEEAGVSAHDIEEARDSAQPKVSIAAAHLPQLCAA